MLYTKRLIQAFAVLAGIAIILSAQACKKDDNNDDTNDGSAQLQQERLKVGRILLEVQAHNVDEALPYYSDSIEYHDPIVSISGIADMTAFFNNLIVVASPNLLTIVHDETIDGDVYSATWTMSGDFLNNPYEARGISIFKFEPNSTQVYYQRDYYSEGDIMTSIPLMAQAILGFRTYYRCAVDPTFDCPLKSSPQMAGSIPLRSYDQVSSDQLTVGRQLVAINAGNYTEVFPYFAPNYEYHDPIVNIYTPDTMAMFLDSLFVASSNLITTIEDETIADDIYFATWTMSGEFDGSAFSAPGMSIVKFVEGTTQTYYSMDYYTEGDIMLGVPQLAETVIGFRHYYREAVDPNYGGN